MTITTTTATSSIALTVAGLHTRYTTEIQGDDDRFAFRVECAIVLANLDDDDLATLKAMAIKNGANKDGPRAGQSQEHWVLPGLLNVNINDLKGDDKKDASDRLTEFAKVMIAAKEKAKDIGGLTKPGITPDDITGLFGSARQTEVRNIVKGLKKGQSGDSADAEAEAEDAESNSETIALMSNLPALAQLDLRLNQPGEVVMLAAHRTADGYRISAQVSVDSKALLRALKKPDLSGLSYQLNGVSEHVLMARSLIVPREVDLPSMASDPKSAKLVAPRATLIRDRWMETSISMVGSPEMIVRTEFRAAIFGDEFLLLNANSRNAFERNIAEPVERVAYNWSGFTDNGIDFVKKEGSKKVHTLRVLDPARWGERSFAHRLASPSKAPRLTLANDQVAKMRDDYLANKESRKALKVEVGVSATLVSFKLGAAKAMEFDAVSEGGEVRNSSIAVPAPDLANVLDWAISQRVERSDLTFAINPAGVLEVGFAGLGADHKVFLASLTGKGARENGSVFQRYSRTTFQVDADQEAA
ncbi:hypothetical protein [Brevundimonas sp. 374]|uniref:hypothetical protein n=1 Tax=Brevundimonas sp. 374 TaxID=1150400 RepID=UPI00088BAEB7|nr:hypothetical protein [Brevundimonas sp. 374]SDQ73920.1 hypothetical protein SAMN02787020_1821 [Brevundimonas sp. 374]